MPATYDYDDLIRGWVDPSENQSPNPDMKIAYANHGPGQLNKWRALLEGDKNSWISISSSGDNQSRKKIIISDGIFTNRINLEKDYKLIATLVRLYDVYFWPGNIKFEDCKPISSTSEFWQKCDGIVSAKKSDVEKALSLQSISTQNFIILDHNGFNAVLHRRETESSCRPEDKIYRNTLDLGYHFNAIKNLDNIINADEITYVKILEPSTDELDYLFKKLPNVTHVELYMTRINLRASAGIGTWIGSRLLNVNVILNFNFYNFALFGVATLPKKIKIIEGDRKVQIAFKDGSYLEELSRPGGVIDDLFFHTAVSDLSKKFPKLKEIHYLHKTVLNTGKEVFYEDNQIAIERKFNKLIKEKLCLLDDKQNQVVSNESMEQISLFDRKISNLTILHSPLLKSVGLSYSIINKIDLSQSCCSIENLSLKDSSINLSDAILFPNLKFLTLDSCDEIENFNFTAFPKLEGLTVKNCINLRAIDFKHASNLKTLNLEKINLNQLDLIACVELKQLNITLITEASVNLSNLKKLKLAHIMNGSTINADGASQLTILSLMNRNDKPAHLTTKGCAALKYITHYGKPENTSNQDIKNDEKNSIVTPRSDLEIFNENSPVSCFSLYDSVVSDNKTGLPTEPVTSNGKLKVVIEVKGKISKSSYRINILDRIEEVDNKVKFSKVCEHQHLENVKHRPILSSSMLAMQREKIKKDYEFALGNFTGEIESNKLYPLPTHIIPDKESFDIYCSNKTIQFYFNTFKNQCFFKLINHDSKSLESISIYYKYRKSDDPIKPLNSKPVLSRELINKIDLMIDEQKSKLGFLKDEKLSLNEKIIQLKSYCSHPNFECGTLTQASENDDPLFDSIKQQKGVCRHRSQAFMLLSHYLGLPSRLIGSENHNYCEIPTETGWKSLDFGGAPIVDHTPKNLRSNPFDIESASIVQASQNDHNHLLSETPLTNLVLEYDNNFSRITKKNEITDVHLFLLSNKILSPLIEVTTADHLRSVKILLIKELKNNYLYIHSPKDFYQYLKPFCLDKGIRQQIDGPLAQLIKKGGTIIVNWSNFTATELASYKSIIDQSPTLLGESIQNVKVIGLKDANLSTCGAFASRCQLYTISNSLLEKVNDDKESQDSKQNQKVTLSTAPIAINQSSQIIKVDLFSRVDWEEVLLGEIKFLNNEIQLKDGILINEASQENKKTLVIYNPPSDPHFSLLLQQIKDEGRIFYNGKFIPVSENLTIITDTVKNNNEAKNVSIKQGKPDQSLKLVHLNLANFHECFELLCIHNSKATNKDGLLGDCIDDSISFYITESIPSSFWQRLVATIEEKYKHLHFNFYLAPRVSIIGYQENTTPREVPTKPSSIIVTNDPDYYVYQVLEKKPAVSHIDSKSSTTNNIVVIDITPQMSISDLIAEVNITTEPNSTVIGNAQDLKNDEKSSSNVAVKFSYNEKDMIKTLREGKTVILNGALSYSLYQQLLPLLSSNPYYYCNGKRESFPGKVVVVVPNLAQQLLIYNEAHEINYSEDDYLKLFNNDDKKIVSHIQQFYKLIKFLPHRGASFPEIPHLRYHHLIRILRAIKENPLKLSNSIKGLLLFDYPVQSEDYAYLNVLSKYYFNKNIVRFVRLSKLRDLHQKFNFNELDNLKKNIWHVLNCYSGADLNHLLDKDIYAHIKNDSDMPSLSSDVLQSIHGKILKQLNINHFDSKDHISHSVSDLKDDKPMMSHIENRNHRLKNLLNDPLVPFIMIKGAAGVGKTFTINQLKADNNILYYEGNEAISDWLKADIGISDRKTCVLLLDEANMSAPGTWDFLKGLIRNDKQIYYQGKLYTLTEKHKVIFTGNPENFSGRYHHLLIQDYAQTLHFKMPSESYLKSHIIVPLLKPFIKLKVDDYASAMLQAYHLAKKHNSLYVFSTRDLESLAQRFLILVNGNEPNNEALLKACIAEFAGSIENLEHRNIFISDLRDLLNVNEAVDMKSKDLLEILPEFHIPKENTYLVEGILQDLTIRQSFIKNPANQFYKQGILIEGEAGLGKSTLYKMVLEQQGFSKDAINPINKYYEITVGEKSAHDTLLKAFHEGSAVILDELNLDENIESLLNQLLTGKDRDGQKAKNPGFIILASQNPSHELGRKSVSQALRNRLHFMYMNPYSVDALIAIAKQKGILEPENFVTQFLHHQRKNPKDVNMRTFYTALSDDYHVILNKLRHFASNIKSPNELKSDITNTSTILFSLQSHTNELISLVHNRYNNATTVEEKALCKEVLNATYHFMKPNNSDSDTQKFIQTIKLAQAGEKGNQVNPWHKIAKVMCVLAGLAIMALSVAAFVGSLGMGGALSVLGVYVGLKIAIWAASGPVFAAGARICAEGIKKDTWTQSSQHMEVILNSKSALFKRAKLDDYNPKPEAKICTLTLTKKPS